MKTLTNFFKSIGYLFKVFIPETKAEWKKVTRPGRPEVISTTIVVVLTSFIFATFLWAADAVIVRLYEGLFSGLEMLGWL
jgi:preprotein translocase SecE subunit